MSRGDPDPRSAPARVFGLPFAFTGRNAGGDGFVFAIEPSSEIPSTRGRPRPTQRGGRYPLWHRGPATSNLRPGATRVTTSRRRDGTRVAEPPGGFAVSELNLALAVALCQRGCHVLHAGAVARDGCCALILGPPGAGKSSLILTAARRGMELISDEIVPFVISDGEAVVSGSNPWIRVDPCWNGGETLSLLPDAVPRRADAKASVDASLMGCRCAEGESRVAALVFLEPRLHAREGEPYRAAPLGRPDALLGLLLGAFRNRVLGEEERRAYVQGCGALARSASAYTLAVREGRESVSEAAGWLRSLLRRSAA